MRNRTKQEETRSSGQEHHLRMPELLSARGGARAPMGGSALRYGSRVRRFGPSNFAAINLKQEIEIALGVSLLRNMVCKCYTLLRYRQAPGHEFKLWVLSSRVVTVYEILKTNLGALKPVNWRRVLARYFTVSALVPSVESHMENQFWCQRIGPGPFKFFSCFPV